MDNQKENRPTNYVCENTAAKKCEQRIGGGVGFETGALASKTKE